MLGETWVAHHGKHGIQSTRAIIAPGAVEDPILKGIEDESIWAPTDTYRVRLPMPDGCRTLLLGKVLTGMNPTDPPLSGSANNPPMPVVWTKEYIGEKGKRTRTFTSTMGSADDLKNESLRRLLVNAALWAVDRTNRIPNKANVSLVGEYTPHSFLTSEFTRGVKPQDLRLK